MLSQVTTQPCQTGLHVSLDDRSAGSIKRRFLICGTINKPRRRVSTSTPVSDQNLSWILRGNRSAKVPQLLAMLPHGTAIHQKQGRVLFHKRSEWIPRSRYAGTTVGYRHLVHDAIVLSSSTGSDWISWWNLAEKPASKSSFLQREVC